MSEINVEIENLKDEIEALRARIFVERETADYWYKRANASEARRA